MPPCARVPPTLPHRPPAINRNMPGNGYLTLYTDAVIGPGTGAGQPCTLQVGWAHAGAKVSNGSGVVKLLSPAELAVRPCISWDGSDPPARACIPAPRPTRSQGRRCLPPLRCATTAPLTLAPTRCGADCTRASVRRTGFSCGRNACTGRFVQRMHDSLRRQTLHAVPRQIAAAIGRNGTGRAVAWNSAEWCAGRRACRPGGCRCRLRAAALAPLAG